MNEKVKEIIHILRECSKDGPCELCKTCPYNTEPYSTGCGKLLSDAALLLEVAYTTNKDEVM